MLRGICHKPAARAAILRLVQERGNGMNHKRIPLLGVLALSMVVALREKTNTVAVK